MRLPIMAFLLAASTYAQSFDSKMPASVPQVKGDAAPLFTLRYIDIEPGTGAIAAPAQEYTVHYTGWLRNGTKFDSSLDRNQPIKFVQGRRQVIPGWDLGFEGMRVGGRRRLFIPYELAYGEKGVGPIPPKAELIFDVQLVSVRDAPNLVPAVDVLVPFNSLSARVIAVANAIPGDKYSLRPPPAQASIAELLTQIADANESTLRSAEFDDDEKPTAAAPAGSQSKDAIVKRLKAGIAAVQKALQSARNGQLSRDAQWSGQATTTRGLFVALDALIAERLASLTMAAEAAGVHTREP